MAITTPAPTIESVVCRSKSAAAEAAQGRDEPQFYLTLVASLIVDELLKPPNGTPSSGYVKSAESRQTDLVECRIKQDLLCLSLEEQQEALKQIIRTFFCEIGI